MGEKKRKRGGRVAGTRQGETGTCAGPGSERGRRARPRQTKVRADQRAGGAAREEREPNGIRGRNDRRGRGQEGQDNPREVRPHGKHRGAAERREDDGSATRGRAGPERRTRGGK